MTLPAATSARLRAVADRARQLPGVVAAIVGHESIYVIGTSDENALRSAVNQAVESRTKAATVHQVSVSFAEDDAIDLREFLSHANMSREQFLQRIGSIRLSVRHLGFRAGFAYLDGWPREWRMPRRPTSRNRVPGGSFAAAGEMAGFYPIDSPGGWNILGRTDAALWDPAREPPNLFAPGDEIVVDVAAGFSPLVGGLKAAAPRGVPIAQVIQPGQLTTIIGRPDWSRLEHGVTPGGPFDEEAAAMANAAAGNPPNTPLLECVLVGPKLQTERRVAFCEPDLTIRETADVGRIHGMRGYLAIEGGIDEARLRYSEGPTVLTKGATLFSGGAAAFSPPSTKTRKRAARNIILYKRGPHDAPPLPEEWVVTPQMNRIGIRLRPLTPLNIKLPADLPSLGAQFGTLQWHADGTLMALGPDHPVTGGYLQPATILTTERWKLAQLTPGERVRLVPV